ncbi:hypothetical protein [Hyalangium rubrum]|uniref:DUF2383 domain-containing protein n=1 Tax=Hyalangium rubrum TaxID=3103134 RepID=A0ABU5HE84_9BACT|nr:hypothetical protein [Hyalangium sp. s54d21]MDY7231118.1 hypothetical protein [Hyalangium sp. s54d21]
MSSFFDDTHELVTTDMQAADDRTLRLAAVPLTEQELEGLIRYQETFLSIAEHTPGAEALARAHTEALKASGLPDARRVEQGNAILRTFSGQRWGIHKLKDKLKQLESQGPEADELRERIREELTRLERTDGFSRRYGEELLKLLQKHEEQLVKLHTRMTGVLSRG